MRRAGGGGGTEMHTTEDIKGTGERKKPYGTEDFADKTAYSKL